MDKIKCSIFIILISLFAFLQGCATNTQLVSQRPELGLTREIGYGFKSVNPDFRKYVNCPYTIKLDSYQAEFRGTKSDNLLKQLEQLEKDLKLTISEKGKQKLYIAAKQLAETGIIRINESFEVKECVKDSFPQTVNIYIPDILAISVSPSKEVYIQLGAIVLTKYFRSSSSLKFEMDLDSGNYLSDSEIKSKFKIK